MLIPDGKGPFPAVNALHDHGAHLFIGKEKMIRPLACEDSTVIKDADEWVASLYEGQYVGDYLAQAWLRGILGRRPHVGRARSAGRARDATATT